MTDRLPGPAEPGDLGHDGDLLEADGAIATLGEVGLESPAQRQDHGGLALELDGRLLAMPAAAGTMAKLQAIRSQGLPCRAMYRPENRAELTLSSGEKSPEIQSTGARDRLGHVIGERPVAAELHRRIGRLDLRDVMAQVLAERLAVELEELEPVRIARLPRDRRDAGLGLKRLQGRRAVIGHRGPAFAVDPGAVNSVSAGQLAKLRDHERVGIRAEERRRIAVAWSHPR